MFIPPNIPFQFSPETTGNKKDLKLLIKDQWLLNTEVKYLLHKKKGLWHLTMIYIAIENPLKFICRKIDQYHSKKKAELFALILQRNIRKDTRGTLKSNPNAFNFCNN